jgi:PLP dependent protein
MSADHPTAIARNLATLRARIAAVAREAGRNPGEIELIAVSKTHPVEAVRAALAAGQRTFGENRVQEAAAKFPALKAAFPDLTLQLIGPLQTNKAVEAVRLFDAIHSLDRPRLADALTAAMAKEGRRPDCFIQVNTGEEPQKAGVLPAEADTLIAYCRERAGLPVIGLMCIPPVEAPPEPHFELLRAVARRHGLERLSMGMSTDFEAAIRCGATEIRVGTAIFGERPARPSK